MEHVDRDGEELAQVQNAAEIAARERAQTVAFEQRCEAARRAFRDRRREIAGQARRQAAHVREVCAALLAVSPEEQLRLVEALGDGAAGDRREDEHGA